MPRIFEKNTPNHTVTTWLGSLQIQGSNRLGPFGWLRRSLSENENGIKWMYQGTPPIHGFSWHTSCLKEEFWGASHSWTNPIVWFPTIHGARLCIVSGFGWTWAHQTRGSYPTVQPKLLVLDDWRLMNAVLIPFNITWWLWIANVSQDALVKMPKPCNIWHPLATLMKCGVVYT